jgi:hypothetical protein
MHIKGSAMLLRRMVDMKITNRNFTIAVFFVVALLAGLNLHRRLAYAQGFRPFVATVSHTSWAEYPYTLGQTSDFFVRQDGSYVEVTPIQAVISRRAPLELEAVPSAANGTVLVRRIFDFSKNSDILVDPVSETTVTTSISSVHRPYRPAYSCAIDAFDTKATVVKDQVAAGQMLGFDVQLSETTFPVTGLNPAPHREVINTWMAPALGCFTMRREQRTEMWDGKAWIHDSATVDQTVSVSFKDTSVAFTIPPNYIETSTGDAAALRYLRDPEHFKDWSAEATKNVNDAYFANRP